MNYLDLSIVEIHHALVKKEVTPLELVKEALKRAKENKDNAFELILEEEAIAFAKTLVEPEVDNYLWGIPYTLKDNIATKGIVTTGGSNILNGYKPTYDSRVHELLKARKAILIGKTTLDELGMGGTGTTGHLGTTTNPYDPTKTHLIGGSSCGSAVSVSAKIVPFSIGSDTGDSIRKPASFANIVGFKPTWSLISRLGLFSFCPSLDHIGFFTNNVHDSAIILEALSSYDPHDSTSCIKQRDAYLEYEKGTIKPKRIAVVKEIIDSISKKETQQAFSSLISELIKVGYEVEEAHIDINILKAIVPTYFILSSAGATSNNANLDGIKFGLRTKDAKTYQDVMIQSRTLGFGEMIKRRFVLGSFVLKAEDQEKMFLKAKRARKVIVDAFKQIFKKYDFVVLPASPGAAPKIDATVDKLSDEYLLADNYLAFGNFGGFPSMTLPLGFDKGLPFGVNITADTFKDTAVLQMAKTIENILGGQSNE